MKALILSVTVVLFLLLSGCNTNNENDGISKFNTSDTTSGSGSAKDVARLIKTAAINIKVKNAEESARAISNLTKRSGGMVFHRKIESTEENHKELSITTDSILSIKVFSPHAEMKVRVPSANLGEFLFNISDLGYFTADSRLDIEDKTLNYLENRLKQENRLSALSNASIKTNKVSTVLNSIVIRDEAIAQNIANKNIEADVAYSVVDIALYQNPIVKKEIMANNNIGNIDLPLGKRLASAMDEGLQYFISIVLVILHLWVFILIGLMFVFGYRYSRGGKKTLTISRQG